MANCRGEGLASALRYFDIRNRYSVLASTAAGLFTWTFLLLLSSSVFPGIAVHEAFDMSQHDFFVDFVTFISLSFVVLPLTQNQSVIP